MKYEFSKLINEDFNDFNKIFFSKDIDSVYKLKIKDFKYLINYEDDLIPFLEDEVLFINNSNSIGIISLSNGQILFFSGLFDSFVGVESLDTYFLVITDTTIFKINKFSFFVFDFNSLSDVILDYKISQEKKEITIVFVEEDMRENLNIKL
ncbi:hypothetical protein FLACOL_00093 [Flavobacterium columnare]|uniref:Uncharacterized protein n=2 Tax=Flavobacterium TaxID=237 RepID=A0ABW8PSQ3_9FLAO|nr:hypothetical protein [Flavobacterium columnare]SPE76115.1 hypothetical protein FLACOL_00093 [Flavobacterium columnare]